MNYKTIFEKAYPKLMFKWDNKAIVYNIKYENVTEIGNIIEFLIDFDRVEDDINVTVVRRVLVSLLFQDFQHIIKTYMSNAGIVRISVTTNLEESL